MRYFGQTPEYWENTCTLHAWNTIWCRELIETPPVDALVASYLGYKAPDSTDQADDAETPAEDAGEWECPFPETTD